MNSAWKIALAVTGALAIAVVLLVGGFVVGRTAWGFAGLPANEAWSRMGTGMMGGGPGWWFDGPGTPGLVGPGGMMGSGGMMGGGMMGGYGGMMAGAALGVEPLTIEQAEAAVEDYLDRLGDDLVLGEVMIFDNHAYAQIVEAGTGIGAMEVLIDPSTLGVYPEHGPNMMWNQKYGRRTGFGGMGGMMGGWTGSQAVADPLAMPVSADEAVELAQAYLDRTVDGYQADEHADVFYGYYTLHIVRDGTTVGMLSVHGTTGQVWVHTWHGDFVEMSPAHVD